jgi:hypothetical protein
MRYEKKMFLNKFPWQASRKDKSAGFSLAEVLVAIFLLGMMVLVIANIPQALSLVATSQAESKAREIAAKKLSDIRLTGYDNLPLGVTNFSDSRLNELNAATAVMTVIDCPLATCPEGDIVKLKQVTIAIDWSEDNEAKHFQVNTLIGKGGLR